MTALDEMGRSPLHYAALRNDPGQARARLRAGDDPGLGDDDGFTPLHLAAQEWSLEVAELLLDHGAQADVTNASGNTPLFLAVFNSRGRGETDRSYGDTARIRSGRTTRGRRPRASLG